MTRPGARREGGEDPVRRVVAVVGDLVAAVRDQAAVVTDQGRAIDEHQVLAQAFAEAATEHEAARAALAACGDPGGDSSHGDDEDDRGRGGGCPGEAPLALEARAQHGGDGEDDRGAGGGPGEAPLASESARAAAARFAIRARDRIRALAPELIALAGSTPRALQTALSAACSGDLDRAVRTAAGHDALVALGARLVAGRAEAGAADVSGYVTADVDDAVAADIADVRAAARAFARREVAPLAARLHADDALVPEPLITAMADAGIFGLSIPESYGGAGLSHAAMIAATEELSWVSLAGAGSLITRPEILSRALLAGGTEAQKRAWLPRIAAGAHMVAIAVTEPDTGSDVANVACRAEPAPGAQGAPGDDGPRAWHITGAKAWCTFGGRADLLGLLARVPAGAVPGADAGGLGLFLVAKPASRERVFRFEQPGGGALEGRAERTPGYRGMHSFSLRFDRWLAPDAGPIGGVAGIGRGFALQMAGFAAGRLQTAGRAIGLAGAALVGSAGYAAQRHQFGRAIGDWGLTRHALGVMAAELFGARALTYAAAARLDASASRASPSVPSGPSARAAALACAQAKLLSCDVAVAVTQSGQLLHGGWGYAEEFPICRQVLDALVLPIFEGTRPVLALKVIARGLLR